MANKDDKLVIKGARENNLKNIDLTLPRNKMIVMTGMSGSGKSSLAFDTIYAEGQRRYVESLSSYARQFLGQMDKPDVDKIDGLSPAISIDQKTTSHNPRSTVGTVTEIYDYLRLMYSKIGVPHCPNCGKEIHTQTIDQVVDAIMAKDGAKLQIMAPVVRSRKGEHIKMLDDLTKQGYVRVRVDGEIRELSDDIRLDKKKKHSIEVVVDRIKVREDIKSRLTDSLETAFKLGDNMVIINDVDDGSDELYSQNYACTDCNISIEEMAPRMFSFNSPFGACDSCLGLGVINKIDEDLIVPDKKLSLNQGAIKIMGWNMNSDSMARVYLEALSKEVGFSLNTPFCDLSKEARNAVLYGYNKKKIHVKMESGNGKWEHDVTFQGIIPTIERRNKETTSDSMKQYYGDFMSESECPECHGQRLSKAALSVTVGGKNIHEVCCMSVENAKKFFEDLQLTEKESIIAKAILKEVRERLSFLCQVGLHYLTLGRSAGSLSGGEAQRIRLATQIGSGLVGVLYILDEPSIGLHQRDNRRLLDALKRLRDLGNTLIVVEHDEETMEEADYIVDIGPKAGVHGGEVIFAGSVEDIKKCDASITGQYLSGERKIDTPKERNVPDGRFLKVVGACENNLKNIDVEIPIGLITCVTGVSGSGKSTLVNQILYRVLARDLNRARTKPGKYKSIQGLEYLDKVIAIDQTPIGRTPRSNPATYTGLFDNIRAVFATTPDAQMRGYKTGRFSFNVKGGRCEACKGDGILKIEMHFLPDVYVPCDVCGGKRYNRETLEVKFKGKSIYDVLDMTVENALEFFKAIPSIKNKLQTLYDVGLGYIKLGQNSTQLSGGEAQRVKLATELSRRSTGKTIYILDEPTTGLHSEDVRKLVQIIRRLREGGNTIVIIEHNLDVIKTADYIIDMGPEGGDEGGTVIAKGSPEEVIKRKKSYTGQYLKKYL